RTPIRPCRRVRLPSPPARGAAASRRPPREPVADVGPDERERALDDEDPGGGAARPSHAGDTEPDGGIDGRHAGERGGECGERQLLPLVGAAPHPEGDDDHHRVQESGEKHHIEVDRNRHRSLLAVASAARALLKPVAQLLLLVLDEPADHLPPQRLDEVGRHARLGGAGADLIDHLLVAPGHVGLLPGLQLDLPGALHIAQTLADEADQGGIDTVNLLAHLGQIGAVGGLAWGGCHARLGRVGLHVDLTYQACDWQLGQPEDLGQDRRRRRARDLGRNSAWPVGGLPRPAANHYLAPRGSGIAAATIARTAAMGTFLDLPREIATALFFAAAIAVAAGALVAGRTQRLLPAAHVAAGAFVIALASFAYAIWRNHRRHSRRMFRPLAPTTRR